MALSREEARGALVDGRGGPPPRGAPARPGEIAARTTGTVRHAPGTEIAREGSAASVCHLLLEGCAFQSKMVADGGRQITALHVAGDFLDLPSLLLKTVHHSVTALTTCHVAVLPHARLSARAERIPGLAQELWRRTLVDAAIASEWLVCLGRRSALARAAHVICELSVRLERAGQPQLRSFRLPITQAQLGDVLGLSAVHINRVVQELRRRGVIHWHGTTIAIQDWTALRKLAEFEAAYLHSETVRSSEAWWGLLLSDEPAA